MKASWSERGRSSVSTLVFFFSSRRRHTRFDCDWSSDVCSSDLYGANGLGKLANALREPRASHIYFIVRNDASRAAVVFQTSDTAWQAYNRWGWEIGRASCRERV